MRVLLGTAATLTLLAAGGTASAENDIALGLPVDCTLGETCYIQQYVDRDPGPGVLDYQCGSLVYEGHKGTDFAVPTLSDMRRGVNVIASAPGVVAALRDGVADVIYSAENAQSVAGRECGNGVVLRHANGWETQYCHMKSGTVDVVRGQRVARGDVLGQIGLSGKTQFPHVQLSVRLNGKEIDPFDTSAMPSCGNNGADLWQSAPAYVPGGLIQSGFAAGVPAYETIKDGTAAATELAPDAAGLVLFGYGYGGRRGDVMELRISGPTGEMISRKVTLDKDQAQFFRAAGKRLTKARWPAGTYRGRVRMLRGKTELGRQDTQITIR
jgi:Peptidase family M23